MKMIKRIVLAFLLIFLIPANVAKADPQTEFEVLKEQYNMMLTENAMLKEDLRNAELTMLELNSIVHKLGLELEKSHSLQVQAENSLEDVKVYVKNLEKMMNQKSGPKAGIVLGGIYHLGEFGAFAGFSLTF